MKMFRIFGIVCALGTALLVAWLLWPRAESPSAPQSIEQSNSKVPISKLSDQISLLDNKSAPSPASETNKPAVIHNAGRNIEVPRGAILPALLLDLGTNGENQVPDNLLLSLEEEFFNEIEETKSKGVAIQDVWEILRSKYDEKYITLFGQDAYLEATSLAADEAREDYESPSLSK